MDKNTKITMFDGQDYAYWKVFRLPASLPPPGRLPFAASPPPGGCLYALRPLPRLPVAASTPFACLPASRWPPPRPPPASPPHGGRLHALRLPPRLPVAASAPSAWWTPPRPPPHGGCLRVLRPPPGGRLHASRWLPPHLPTSRRALKASGSGSGLGGGGGGRRSGPVTPLLKWDVGSGAEKGGERAGGSAAKAPRDVSVRRLAAGVWRLRPSDAVAGGGERRVHVGLELSASCLFLAALLPALVLNAETISRDIYKSSLLNRIFWVITRTIRMRFQAPFLFWSERVENSTRYNFMMLELCYQSLPWRRQQNGSQIA
ncbi:hypothetical protein GUJ93_ZPchr0005g15499 [Zizania palustris]|uniref:Uncharacterized protein n=1 Tax=Zizania palustris TaxID=103762 RepID=A0A8J5VIH1_ZIZPA|nr:hypothetical protein GUJ93_ZPchr0005g15499 [Zizania palustris]